MITETLLTLDFFKLQTAKNASNNLLFPTTKICMYIRVVTLGVLLRDGNNSIVTHTEELRGSMSLAAFNLNTSNKYSEQLKSFFCN